MKSFENLHFGMDGIVGNLHVKAPLKETEAIFDHYFKLLSKAGILWERHLLSGVFSWNVMEQEKGKYDWTIPDTYVKAAQKYSVQLAPVVWPFTAWDQKAWEGTGHKLIDGWWDISKLEVVPCDDSWPIPPRYWGPHDWDAYSKWMIAMVERYDGDGVDDMPGLKYPIKYWEIENEVGIKVFWPSDNPEDYTTLLKTSYLAAKKADPECKIVFEGWAFKANEPFWRHAIELGKKEGQQYFEVMNLHSYSYEQTINDVTKTKDLLAEYGLKMPIWITEWGLGGGARHGLRPGRPPFYIAKKVIPNTHQDEARFLIKCASIAFYLGVDRLYWVDPGTIKPPKLKLTVEDTYRGDMCMFDLQGRPNLIYYTAGLMISKLEGFKSVEKLDLGYSVNAYRYDMGPEWNPTLRQIFVLWNDVGDMVIKVRNFTKDTFGTTEIDMRDGVTLEGIPSEKVTTTNTIPKADEDGYAILDEDGNPVFEKRTLNVVEGKVTIKLSTNPIILEFNQS